MLPDESEKGGLFDITGHEVSETTVHGIMDNRTMEKIKRNKEKQIKLKSGQRKNRYYLQATIS